MQNTCQRFSGRRFGVSRRAIFLKDVTFAEIAWDSVRTFFLGLRFAAAFLAGFLAGFFAVFFFVAGFFAAFLAGFLALVFGLAVVLVVAFLRVVVDFWVAYARIVVHAGVEYLVAKFEIKKRFTRDEGWDEKAAAGCWCAMEPKRRERRREINMVYLVNLKQNFECNLRVSTGYTCW